MPAQTLIFWLYLGVAALLTGLGWPLWRNWIPPNPWYGFRTPATLREERIWYPINHETGLWFVLLGGLMGVVVVSMWRLNLPVGPLALVNSIPLIVGLAAMTVRGFWRIHRMKRMAGEASQERE